LTGFLKILEVDGSLKLLALAHTPLNRSKCLDADIRSRQAMPSALACLFNFRIFKSDIETISNSC
jgi:hypothetical protein